MIIEIDSIQKSNMLIVCSMLVKKKTILLCERSLKLENAKQFNLENGEKTESSIVTSFI